MSFNSSSGHTHSEFNLTAVKVVPNGSAIPQIEVEGNPQRGGCWSQNLNTQFPAIPSTHNNGKVKVDVDFPHRGYSMQTTLVNGKPNGESSILNDKNVEVAKVTYVNGIASGPCKLYDENGRLFFEGSLLNGYRHGKGKEFDEEGNVVYEGDFENGKRKGNFIQMKNMKGYWKELNEKGEVISICHKDRYNQNDGLCYHYKNGKIYRISNWKFGKEVQLLKEFRDDKMIEYTNGTKCYAGGYRDSLEDNFPREGEGEDYDIDGKSLKYFGSHWNGMWQGKGIKYHRGKAVFDGIWFRNHQLNGIIWGGVGVMFLIVIISFVLSLLAGVALLAIDIIFWAITCAVFPSVRYVFYHKFKCLFKGKTLQVKSDLSTIKRLNYLIPWILFGILLCAIVAYPLSLLSNQGGTVNVCEGKSLGSTLVINSHSCNDVEYESLIVTSNSKLTSIAIEDECFKNTKTFTMDGLKQLKSLNVGRNSFTLSSRVKDSSRSFHVLNCEELTSVNIGPGSFSDYAGDFELKNLPKLSSLQIGEIGTDSHNFFYTSLLLEDLPALTTFILGDYSFQDSPSVTIDSLPQLKSVRLGSDALRGSTSFDCSLTMSNLPALTLLSSSANSFQYYASAEIHDLPLASDITLPHSFDNVESFNVYNVHDSLKNVLLIPLYITLCSDMNLINQRTSTITVSNEACNSQSYVSFSLTNLNNVDSISIGDENFMYVDTFTISELNQLNTITVGTTSFTTQHDNWDTMKMSTSRSFHVVNCTQLQSIVMGRYSFSDYAGQFELTNLPQLQSISFGDTDNDSSNFYGASFIIEDLPLLSSITLGSYTFSISLTTRISNLPNLATIVLGSFAVTGNRDNVYSSLVMNNLPKLVSISSGGASFRYPRNVTLSNIPILNTVTLDYSFAYVFYRNIQNIHTSFDSIVPTVRNFDYIQSLSSSSTTLNLPDRTCNDITYTTFDFSRFSNLKVLTIGDDSFYSVITFNINGMNQLESITIGTTSFTHQRENWDDLSVSSSRSFHVLNCAKLESIVIGRFSFSDYAGTFELKNLPLLTTLTIGSVNSDSSNFFAASFAAENLPDLTSITIGAYSFYAAASIRITNLPDLESISCGPYGLAGRNDNSCTLTMSNLPSLETILSYSGTFKYPRTVILLNINNLISVSLPNSFSYVQSKTINSVSSILANLV